VAAGEVTCHTMTFRYTNPGRTRKAKPGHPRRRAHVSHATIAVRLTVHERASLRRAAKVRGLSVSEVVRRALVDAGILEAPT